MVTAVDSGREPVLTAQPDAATANAQWRIIARRFLANKVAMASLIVFFVLALGAFIGPLLWKWNYLASDGIALSQAPSSVHPFGTDSQGHDVLGQLMRGLQTSLKVAFLAVLIDTAIGVALGALAGYYRGWVDTVLMRLSDLVLTIPTIALLAVLANTTTGGAIAIGVVIGLFAWAVTSRLVRAEYLALREREFVEAARALGASDRRIIIRHILPNSVGTIIVNATLAFAVAIILEAGLSFIGFGIHPPDISLGQLISVGVEASETRPWLFYFPGLVIVVLVLTINFIGDAVRDAFDPTRNRKVK